VLGVIYDSRGTSKIQGGLSARAPCQHTRIGHLGVICVPDRRGQEQQVCPILVNNIINVIKNVCICAAHPYCVYDCSLCSDTSTYVQLKIPCQAPKLGQPRIKAPVGRE
jgi:hypothetical protein